MHGVNLLALEAAILAIKSYKAECLNHEYPEKGHLLKSKLNRKLSVVVAFFDFFSSLVIARNPPKRFWRKLVDILPFNLPDLPKTSRTSKYHRKTNILETGLSRVAR